MARLILLSTAVLFCASSVLAQYDQLVFATNATKYKCPKGLSFDCVAPNLCVHEALLDKWYCCGPGSGAVCWAGSTTCSGSDKTTPGSNQLGCGSYCCLNSREECTQRTNQINICWATATNPLLNLTGTKLNETFSSLSAANPTASTLSFDLQAAIATSTPTPSASASSSASSSASAASQTGSSTSTPTTSPPPAPSSGLSGGAIGGIVVGIVGGLAVIAGAAFFFWRRGKNKNNPKEPELESIPAGSNPYNNNGFAYGAHGQQEKYAHEVYTPGQQHAHQFPPHELDAGPGLSEVDGSKPVVHGQHVPK